MEHDFEKGKGTEFKLKNPTIILSGIL